MVFITVILVLILCIGCSGCGDGCASCAGISQICLGCRNEYWHYKDNCKRCPENCQQCSDDTHCSKCKTGFYGTACLLKCTLCKDGLCDIEDGRCINGCIDGYYEDGTHPTATCRKCSDNCKLCQSQRMCSNCDNGFYELNYESSPGNHVSVCVSCLPVCEECQTSNICSICEGDFFGSSCNIPCSKNCSRLTSYETCRLKDGFCLNGCKNGSWGDICNKSCYAGCNSTQCDQSDGSCEKCHGAYYGAACNKPCSDHCADNGSLLRSCNNSDGRCDYGCEDGFYGEWCNKTSTTKQTGTDKSTCNSQLHQQDCSETKFYILGFVSGVGLSLMVAAGFQLVCFLRRRRKFTTETTNTLETKEEKAYENTTLGMRGMSSTETDYERLQGDKLDDQQQYTELGTQEQN